MVKEVEEFEIKRKGAKLILVILIYFEIQRRKFEKLEVPFCSIYGLQLLHWLQRKFSLSGYCFGILCFHGPNIKNLLWSWLQITSRIL